MADTIEKQETHRFNAEVSKVLKLVIHSLYTNRDIFLRELISNASDACEKLRYLTLVEADKYKDSGDLHISLAIDKTAQTLSITDSGIGMNRDELINNLGTIAKSGTEQFFSQLTGDNKKDTSLIGQFGVGFYSVYMVADKVQVLSRKAGEPEAWLWESDGEGEFTITQTSSDTLQHGTQITLHLKGDSERYLDKFALQHIVETYSDHIAFPIELKGDGDEVSEIVNSSSALWTRQKSEISEEQYREFYHHVGHTADEPFLTLHNKVEGKLSYTNLLFVPSLQPFDLFHPDRRRRVKLYVRRVFITDENVDLIPHYLRFLRGVVDSEDMPLNISRETLQANPQLTSIRDSITKRVLQELKKKAEKDPEAYKEFWTNFGSVLKEGLCEGMPNKEPLLDACRFHSTRDNGASLTGLDDYIARMKEGQKHIYYITGDRLEAIRQSPQLEGFAKNEIEVLLLSDHVDDFWVTVAPEFKNKRFRSVLIAGKDLEKFSAQTTEEAKKVESEPEAEENKASMDALIIAMRQILGDEVKDIRTTAKLTESPVCLATDEGAMSMRMERFLVEHKQLNGASGRILEINPHHPIISGLAKRVSEGDTSPEIEDMAHMLLDQAKIIEGEELKDPAAFTRRINALLAKQ